MILLYYLQYSNFLTCESHGLQINHVQTFFFLITVNTKQLCYAWLGKMKCLSLVLMTKLLYCMIYEVSYISLQTYSSVGSYAVQRFDGPKKTIF